MKYMIVSWDEENRKWNILHYSHDWDDVQKQMERFKGGELMITYNSIITEEKKQAIMAKLKPMMEGLSKYIKKC